MFEVIKEMKQAGLTNIDIVYEFLGAVSVFMIPVVILLASEMF